MEILIGISVLFNIFIVIMCYFLINSIQVEKKDLLNRLMAKNYQEYATFKHIEETPKETPVTSIFDEGVYPVN